jgi:hypothetical protein
VEDIQDELNGMLFGDSSQERENEKPKETFVPRYD